MDAVKVIAEPRRRELLRLCWHTEVTASDLAARFDVTFGAVTQHLRVLRDAGLVTKFGGMEPRHFYRANRAALGPLAQYLESMWGDQLDALAALAEAAERTMPAWGDHR
jgi:DNA-binding transcriptional ArsR family regulator